MGTMIKMNLTLAQIEFCRYYEVNLLNKNTASFDKIKTAGEILGEKVDTSCPSCARNSWLLMLNKYNAISEAWNEFKKQEDKKPIEPVALWKKYEDEEKPKTFPKKKAI